MKDKLALLVAFIKAKLAPKRDRIVELVTAYVSKRLGEFLKRILG